MILYFEMDEDVFKRFVKTIIDNYEKGLHELGNYEDSVKETQDRTLDAIAHVGEEVHDNNTIH
jgi:hypothetical protein